MYFMLKIHKYIYDTFSCEIQNLRGMRWFRAFYYRERERETGRNSHNIPPPTIARTGRRQDVQGEDPDGGALPVRQDDDRQLPGGRHGDSGRGVPAHRRGQDLGVRARQRQRQQQEHQGSDSYLLPSHFLLYS